ncbi:hypothetical protein [Chitinophaga pinensis]|uniref:Uncharacterized protein n=1 Tax=Chitinophaga pinensis TaxID=79329 RepID=A0A5C6LKJ3_9BACT|nr:hypothetical protein [Chitinophaga pinensis]TWV93040.1 hypothetical protein FEF09_27595 [Chitinophaga pinensis]
MTAGKLLSSNMASSRKTGILAIAGAILLLLGFGVDLAGISPIIKRISTAGLYWLLPAGYC